MMNDGFVIILRLTLLVIVPSYHCLTMTTVLTMICCGYHYLFVFCAYAWVGLVSIEYCNLRSRMKLLFWRYVRRGTIFGRMDAVAIRSDCHCNLFHVPRSLLNLMAWMCQTAYVLHLHRNLNNSSHVSS